MYKDDIRRAAAAAREGHRLYRRRHLRRRVGLAARLLHDDRRRGREAVQHIDPILSALAPGDGTIDKTPHRDGRNPTAEQGYLHCGPAGAGHFVKMVHNGIEYGIMQAYAEGFDVLKNKNSTSSPKTSASTSTWATSPKFGGAAR